MESAGARRLRRRSSGPRRRWDGLGSVGAGECQEGVGSPGHGQHRVVASGGDHDDAVGGAEPVQGSGSPRRDHPVSGHSGIPDGEVKDHYGGSSGWCYPVTVKELAEDPPHQVGRQDSVGKFFPTIGRVASRG